jgi:uncharacterized protein
MSYRIDQNLAFHPSEQLGLLTFLNDTFGGLAKCGLDITALDIDHICYRTLTEDNYKKIKNYFRTRGKLLIESMVGGRMIATYEFEHPVEYKGYKIPLIEVPAPKMGSHYREGFEHIEVVIKERFETFMQKYPQLKFDTSAMGKEFNAEIRVKLDQFISVKFHQQSLKEVIEIEKKSKR